MANETINIIGAGFSGLSAAITLARAGIKSRLISSQMSERAQSVLAEGGINAALNTMGEDDTTENHFNDTMRGGCYLADEEAVRDLTDHAPDIVNELVRLGVPFLSQNGQLILRNFGGQKKKRTAYAKSSTGKMMMTALIDEARRYEAQGLIRRYGHHDLIDMHVEDDRLQSIVIKDTYTHKIYEVTGQTVLCTGGLNGLFKEMTTGTTQNTANAAAIAFNAGAAMANLEFIQYHPTTVQISGKRMLISEAARGEGGRLVVMKNGQPYYFMEDKYPELGNLMPRDVVSREMTLILEDPSCDKMIYLDLTGLDQAIWQHKLSDLRDEIIDYLNIDPQTQWVPVSPGIHFFMGGFYVNKQHETTIKGLYAAGEAACQYHGANRLGGNSMLGAIYGGHVAAQHAMTQAMPSIMKTIDGQPDESDVHCQNQVTKILSSGLGIIRTPEAMQKALLDLTELFSQSHSSIDQKRIQLAMAMVLSALERQESRGAHTRVDYPETRKAYAFPTIAVIKEGSMAVTIGDHT